MRVGYIRVSTAEQNTGRQEEMMRELNVERVFIDKSSGKTTDKREALKEMMEFVREGDIVIVSEISRFARNTRDLLGLIEELERKGVEFESQKEKIDTRTPSGRFMLTIFGAISQLEREYILARQKEGIELAKAKGKYAGRKPLEVDKVKFSKLYSKWKGGELTARAMMKELNLQPNTFYRRVQEWEEENGIAHVKVDATARKEK